MTALATVYLVAAALLFGSLAVLACSASPARLVACALINAGVFHAVTLRTADVWDSQEMRASVVGCGRYLAED